MEAIRRKIVWFRAGITSNFPSGFFASVLLDILIERNFGFFSKVKGTINLGPEWGHGNVRSLFLW